jgi:hypothetical protein
VEGSPSLDGENEFLIGASRIIPTGGPLMIPSIKECELPLLEALIEFGGPTICFGSDLD